MVITELPVTLQLPVSRAPRSTGVHVSSIIRCIAVEAKILTIEDREDLSLVDVSQQDWWDGLDEVSKLRIAIGLAWEEWYLGQLEDVVDHPGEMCVEGIYMTHDGESLDLVITERGARHQILAVHEVKATYKSVNTVGDLSGQWMWQAQMMAYCRGLNCLTAYMHTLFLCGDYSWPIRPCLKKWRNDYTQQDIDDNWSVLRQYRDERI